jgi:hypothetical protein
LQEGFSKRLSERIKAMSLPIVGAHFRPPAKAILSILPIGAPLWAIPEPANPYDPNAIAIFVKTEDIPEGLAQAFNDAAAGYGHDWSTLQEQPAWHLGYIPAKIAIFLAPELEGKEHLGSLAIDPQGKPKVRLDIAKRVEEMLGEG